MGNSKSHLIDYFKQVAGMMSGKQKDYWDWKLKNAQALTHVKTDEIREQYPEIDYYLKHNKVDIKQKECYRNAGKLCVEVDGVDYVEGEISYHGIPIEHAWNKIDGKYFDITKDILFPHNSDYAEYVKIIELDVKEYSAFLFKYKHWGGFMIEKFLKDSKLKESFYPRLFETDLMDKYYWKKYGFPIEYEKYDSVSMEEKYDVVSRVKGVPIVKNPRYLYDFDKSVRAILDSKGNLYVAMYDGDFNHGTMANALVSAKEIKTPLYNERAKKQEDVRGIYIDQSNFVLLNRLHDKNMFVQSDMFVWEGEKTERMMRLLKKKHPNFQIHLRQS